MLESKSPGVNIESLSRDKDNIIKSEIKCFFYVLKRSKQQKKTLKKHDQKFHIKKEKDNQSKYNCDQFSATFIALINLKFNSI